MIRNQEMSGDDRSTFAVPQGTQINQLPIITDMIFTAAVCIGRGQVSQVTKNERANGKLYGLFLPSKPNLVTLGQNFNPVGLTSRY